MSLFRHCCINLGGDVADIGVQFTWGWLPHFICRKEIYFRKFTIWTHITSGKIRQDR